MEERGLTGSVKQKNRTAHKRQPEQKKSDHWQQGHYMLFT